MSAQLSIGGRSRTLDNTTNGVRRHEESLENRFQSGWYPTSDVLSRAILLSEDRSTEKGITIRRSVGQLIIGYLSRRPVTEIFSRRASVSLSETRRDRSRSTCEMGAERGRRGPRRSRAWEMDEPLKLAEIEGRGELRRELPREWIERDLGHWSDDKNENGAQIFWSSKNILGWTRFYGGNRSLIIIIHKKKNRRIMFNSNNV